jgi:MGT family glycosyltransferase
VDGENGTSGRRVERFRDVSSTAVDSSPLPPWGDPDHPLVYVSFGSVTAGIPPFAGIYRSVLDALAGEPLRVLMTTGGAIEPESLAPVPANARVEQWRPQAGVMPYTDVVVGHGGFGTTMAALAGGVPQVVIPLFAFDQFQNAKRVAAIGTGVCLEGGPGAVPQLAPTLAKVIGDTAYKEKALGIVAAMAKLPEVAQSVPFLEQVAAQR